MLRDETTEITLCTFSVDVCAAHQWEGSFVTTATTKSCRGSLCFGTDDDGDVLQCNEKFIARHRRSTESDVQRALKHQCLDREHIFLILFVSVTNVFGDVVEMLHVFGSVSADVLL